MPFDYVETLQAMNAETAKLSKTINNLTGNRGFLAFRRFLTGSDLWKVINKFMGFLNIMQGYYRMVAKQNTALVEQIQNMAKLRKNIDSLDFSSAIAGGNNLLDLVRDLSATDIDTIMSGPMYALGGGGPTDKKKIIDEMRTNIPLFGDLTKDYGDEQAARLLMELLKPLSEEREQIMNTMKQQVALFSERDPIKKWILAKKQKLSNMWDKIAKFPWKSFGGMILKGILWFAAIVIGLYFLKGFITNSKEVLTMVWDGMKMFFGVAAMFFGAAVDGLGLIYEGIMNGEISKVLIGLLAFFGGIFAGLVFVAFGLVIGALATLGALIFGGLLKLIDGEANSLTEYAKGAAQVISMLSFIAAAVVFFTSGGWVAGVAYWLAVAIVTGIAAITDAFHTGGVTRGGLSLVGERGPELVRLPGGTTVHSNSQSKKMMGGNPIHVHVNGRVGASDAEIRDIADKVAQQINMRMNRTSATNVGF